MISQAGTWPGQEIMVLYERCQRIFHEHICSGLKVYSTNQPEYLVFLLRQHFSPLSSEQHALKAPQKLFVL